MSWRFVLASAALLSCVAGSDGPTGPLRPAAPGEDERPDLTAGPIEAPDRIPLDSILYLRVGVRNAGTVSAGPGWVIRVFLSSDPVIDSADFQIDQFVTSRELQAGGEDGYRRNKKLYRGLPTGPYFIGSILDVTEVVQETAEGNNILTSPGQIVLMPLRPKPGDN